MSDDEILARVEAAFADVPRPARFTPFDADPQNLDHEEILQSRDRRTLSLQDVLPTWDPMWSCTPEGLAYYFPRLASFALTEPFTPDWYGAQLLSHVSWEGEANAFLRFCNAVQCSAVAQLLEHLYVSRRALVDDNLASDDFVDCIRVWKSRCV